MKIISLFLTITFFCFCRQAETKILSPKEKVISLPYQDLISETNQLDTISDLNSFSEINNLWIVGAKNGIYLIDNQTKKIHKYFKFEIKSHKELFDGQDSIVGFNFIDLVVNKGKEKLLVIISNGIVFQVDLKSYKIDWLVKFINRIETATYSDNGETIAIGTRYDYKSKSGREITEYFSSLFLIDSHNGQFIDFFNESASVKRILFKDNDTKLLVAYDWNYTDSYIWDIDKKDKSILQFREQDAYLYDIALLGDKDFITVNGNGISKWSIQNPKEKNLIFSHSNFGYERILENKSSKGYVFIAYSNLFFFDKQLHLNDSLKLPILFEDAQNSDTDSLIILKNLANNNEPSTLKEDGKEGFYYFNLSTKTLSTLIDRPKLNEIIKTNWH